MLKEGQIVDLKTVFGEFAGKLKSQTLGFIELTDVCMISQKIKPAEKEREISINKITATPMNKELTFYGNIVAMPLDPDDDVHKAYTDAQEQIREQQKD